MATAYLSRSLGAATFPRLVPQRAPVRGQPPFVTLLDPAPASRMAAVGLEPEGASSVVAAGGARVARRRGDAPLAGDRSLPPTLATPSFAAPVPPAAFADRIGTGDTPQAAASADQRTAAIGQLSTEITAAAPAAPASAPPGPAGHTDIEVPGISFAARAPAAPTQLPRAAGSTTIPPQTDPAPTVRPAPMAIATPAAEAQAAGDPLFPVADAVTPQARARAPASSRTQPASTVQIGTIEVTIDPSVPAAQRRTSEPLPARLARGFASFGWTQS